ncbi:branched-chain amino acid ABC transporter permease [Orrella sp. 11846]|uniref:branched-chain amino acid ABC transporter permease n=1 Tax=Orrella sp. 11846 TaxID=3409913 RepID=UPI003B5B212F
MNSSHSNNKTLPFIVLAILALVVIAVPYVGNTYLVKIVINLCILIGLAASWNLVGGLAGQLSFGHAAFFGMGAYVLAVASDHQIPYPVAFLLGGFGAVVLSLIAYPTFRTSGTYFAIITIAFLESAKLIAVNMEGITHGNSGYIIMDSFMSNDLFPYYLIAGIAALILLLSWVIIHSRFGLRLRALSQDQDAAQDLGVPVQQYKMASLAISAFFCGVLGAYYAKYIGFIDPESVFSIRWSFDMIMMSIIGGLGTFFGPIVGAIVLTLVSEFFRITVPSLSLLVYGAIMMLMIVFWPSGIVGFFQRLSSGFKRGN